MKTFFATIGAAFLLSACAGALPGNPQGLAGINKGEFEYDPQTGKVSGEVIGGKESEAVKLSVKTPDGLEVTYSAKGVKAFDGQAVRAAVERAVSDGAKQAMPGIVDSVVSAVRSVVQ